MPHLNKPRSAEQGFSTIEMLVALPILIVGLTSAVLVAFASQSLVLDTETNAVGLELAQTNSEDAKATSKVDFYGLSTASTNQTVDGLSYAIARKVLDFPCLKMVESRAEWSLQSRPQYSSLTTLIANAKEAAASGNDCSTGFPSPWLNPDTYLSTDIDPSGNKGTGVDVVRINNTRYAFLSSRFSKDDKADLWAYNLAQLNNGTLAGSLNIDGDKKDFGVNALDVAQSSNGKWYAYLAHATSATSNYRQLIVVDVSDPTKMQLISGATRTLPGVGNSYPEGWRVRYFDNKLYIGTRETSGPELTIYNVSDPTNPVWLSSKEINHNVEDILVRKQMVAGVEKTLVYLALTSSASSEEVWVLDASSLTKIGGFNGSGDVDANVLAASGNKLFVGKDRSASYPELLVLDISNPYSLSQITSKDIPIGPNTQITALSAVGNYLFMGTSDSNSEFQVWDIGNLNNIWQRSTFNFSASATGLEYIDNVVVLSVASNDALKIIYDTDSPPL